MPRILKGNRSTVNWVPPDTKNQVSGLLSPEDCVLASQLSAMKFAGVGYDGPLLDEDILESEQAIIEVTQDEVKKALKSLLSKKDAILALLYSTHEKYNQEYFQGRLSMPLITIEKLSNRTLGNYMSSTDTTGLENHITLNRNFVALNTETRVLEALKHEMIHQYQDQVIYEKHDKSGKLIHEGEKRPKDWHNKDFKDLASKVGILANGRKGYGSPVKMPEPKSYNRKFICGCIASNGYPMTIWSTREVKAVCSICTKPYIEVKKAGEVIPANASDVEIAGQDAIEDRMKGEFSSFEKFKEKYSLTDKIKALKKKGTKYKEGIYQKGHNAFLQGYHYWVAYGDLTGVNEPKTTYSPLKVVSNPINRSNRLKRGAGKSV